MKIMKEITFFLLLVPAICHLASCGMDKSTASKKSFLEIPCFPEAVKNHPADSGIVNGVLIKMALVKCLKEAGDLSPYFQNVPPSDAVIKTVKWRIKTSKELGIDDANNLVVKGIQEYWDWKNPVRKK